MVRKCEERKVALARPMYMGALSHVKTVAFELLKHESRTFANEIYYLLF